MLKNTSVNSYEWGVEWIALNDDPGSPDSIDLHAVAGYISTCLLADLFNIDCIAVAADIVQYRVKGAA